MCVVIGFHWSRVWQISFWCSPIVCQAFGWWGLDSACACTFQFGWCGCSVVGLGSLGVTLGVFLAYCVLCCAGDFDSASWRELMDDETSSRYIFLFMLLLIAFLVIDLSTKANIYIILLVNEQPVNNLLADFSEISFLQFYKYKIKEKDTCLHHGLRCEKYMMSK